MIPPTPGPDAASRLFGSATPPDGAGPIGPDQVWPTPITPTREEVLRGLNPLQHVPVLGTFYRVATGETIPSPMRVLGAGLIGGPVGALGAGFFGIIEFLISHGPDLSRPPAPAGMSATGSEVAMMPVSPGPLENGAYTTLATSQPEWLGNSPIQLAFDAARGQASYQQVAAEWSRTQSLEKGVA